MGSCHSYLAVVHAVREHVAAAATEMAYHIRSVEVVGTAKVSEVSEEDVVEEAVVVSSDHARVAGSVSSARLASVAVGEALDLDALVLERPRRPQVLVRSVPILLVEEERAEGLAVREHCAVAVSIAPAALWQRLLAGPQGSRTGSISMPTSVLSSCTPVASAALELGALPTYIPVLRPLRQVWMVHPAIPTNMLAGPNDHVL